MSLHKKQVAGFTLVELIVVIAIIGVLAGILVPSMLGYVTKAKFSGANSSAKSLYNAGMSACRETDVVKPIPSGIYSATSPTTDVADSIRKYVYNYFPSCENASWAIKVDGDVIVATCFSKDASDMYVGTYPRPNSKKGLLNNQYATYLTYGQTGQW